MQSQREGEIGRGDGRQAGYAAARATDHVGRGTHGGWSDQSARSLALSKKKNHVKIAKLASEEEEEGSIAPSSRLLLAIASRYAYVGHFRTLRHNYATLQKRGAQRKEIEVTWVGRKSQIQMV